MNFGSGEFTMSKTYKDQKAKKVGYKNPPKANQWKAGQSGNPSGKKKTTNKPSEALNEISCQTASGTYRNYDCGQKAEGFIGRALAA